MQRLLATLLLVLFSVSLTMPLLSSGTEAKLPACCRRDGKHGCGMKMKPVVSSSGVAWRAAVRCDQFGKGTVTPAAAKAIPASRNEPVATAFAAPSAAVGQIEARARVSFSRSRQKRGPPSLLS